MVLPLKEQAKRGENQKQETQGDASTILDWNEGGCMPLFRGHSARGGIYLCAVVMVKIGLILLFLPKEQR